MGDSGIVIHNNQQIRNNQIKKISGYPLRPWLMTPFRNPEAGTPEERFNAMFTSIRSTIERCNGLLKARFRCLLQHRTLHYAPTKAVKIIKACCILHNICINNNVEKRDDVELPDNGFDGANVLDYNEMVDVRNVNPHLVAGRALRERYVHQYFPEQ